MLTEMVQISHALRQKKKKKKKKKKKNAEHRSCFLITSFHKWQEHYNLKLFSKNES